jgi:peptidoglycan/LPS O-acetylase OafA/YrhL
MFVGVAMNHFYTHQKNHLIYFLLGLGLLFLTFCGFELVNNQSLTNSTSYLFSFLIFLSAMFISKKIQFKSRFLEFLSKISYPLYVVHAVLGYIILYFVTTIAQFSNNISILIAFLVATLVAFMLHKFIEVPTHQFGKKIIEQNG